LSRCRSQIGRPLAGDKNLDANGAKKNKKGRKEFRHEDPDSPLLVLATFLSRCVLLKGVWKRNLR